jgi:protein involved in polysaccharide export with SLBB domain
MELNQALNTALSPVTTNAGAADHYQVACPDVLSWSIDGQPDLTGQQAIGADGRIDLGPLGRLRVEGHTLAEIAPLLAEQAQVPTEEVHVQVAEFHSQQLYLFGEVTGTQRAVAYRGQETLLELLRRTGGITPGAAPNEVYVVRSRIAEGQQPTVFRIDLQSIVMNQDATTNIHLQPFDQVYVGETKQSSLKKCVPPCLCPLYKALCGLNLRHQQRFPQPPPEKAVAQMPPVPVPSPPLPNRHRAVQELTPPILPMPRRLDTEPEPTLLPAPRRLDP